MIDWCLARNLLKKIEAVNEKQIQIKQLATKPHLLLDLQFGSLDI